MRYVIWPEVGCVLLAAGVAWAGVDDASRYSGTSAPSGWIASGHRGDVDFGSWEFEATANGGAAGRFLGDSSLGGANINTGGQAFALFANPPQATAPVAAAIRKFAEPALATGDTLSFRLAVNYRNGTKGFTLRNATGTSQWNFSVGRVDGTNDGYYIRNGVSGSAFDNGQRFGGYHANTVFTFTFTQREREVQWTAVRSGGVSATVSGTLPVESGTIADLRFFITGTDAGGLAANNLYFNNLSLTTEARGDAPLTIGERRTPGVVPSYLLRFSDPAALNTVTMRHSRDWNASWSLTNTAGVWAIDIRSVLTATNNGTPLPAGWHEFKFRTNSAWEGGTNRWLYIDPQGRVAAPPAVYLTWQRDPTTTMTAHWHNFSNALNQLRWRGQGGATWNTNTARTTNAPVGDRLVHTVEMTNLSPGATYEFQVDGYTNTFSFRTMPASLSQPVKFAVAGDADIGPDADAMAAAIAAKDPAFLAMIGDHAYEDSRAENFWRWEWYLQSYFSNLRAPDGRLIPIVAGLGNHEIYNGWGEFHPDFENTADWRLRYGSYFFRYFSFPGPSQPYGVLDFGNYLSLIILDTEHSSPQITGTDAQTQWLAQRLNERRTVTHLLPMYHVPAYPSVRALSDPIPGRIRAQWLPLMESAGVRLAFENHDHAYKRSKPMLGGVTNSDGIVFAGDGAWGVSLRTPDASRTYLQGTEARNHAFLVTISSTGRTIEAVDKAGVVFDSFTQPIDGIPPAPAPLVSSMATNSFSLSWSEVPRAVKYKVIRSDGTNFETANPSYTDPQWTPGSGYTYVIEAINRAGHSTNHPTVAAAPKRVWALTNNLPWNISMTADSDGDGVPNLLEYFHGLNPLAVDGQAAVAVTASNNQLVLRYRRNSGATDVSPVVRWSDNLSGWSNATVASEVDDGPGWKKATVNLSAGETRKFLKIEVTE